MSVAFSSIFVPSRTEDQPVVPDYPGVFLLVISSAGLTATYSAERPSAVAASRSSPKKQPVTSTRRAGPFP